MDLKQLATQYGGKPVTEDPSSLAAQFGGVPVPPEQPAPKESIVSTYVNQSELAAQFGGKPVSSIPEAPASATPTESPYKVDLRSMGVETDPDRQLINYMTGKNAPDSIKAAAKTEELAQANLTRAKDEAQRALRSGASVDQANEIFVKNLAPVPSISNVGNVQYPDSFLAMTRNAIARMAKQGVSGYKAMGALAADVTGFDETADRLLQEAEAKRLETLDYPSRVRSINEVKSFKDAVTRLYEGSVENAGTLAQSISGAAAARIIAEKGATELAKKMSKEAAEKLVEKASRYGTAVGAFATSTGLEAGSMYQDIYSETGERRPDVALALAPVAGALDAILPAKAVNTAMRKQLMDELGKTLVQRYGVDTLKSMGIEGATEFVQTMIEKGALSIVDGRPLLNKENLIDAADAAFIGTGLGAGTQLAAQGIQDFSMRGIDRDVARQSLMAEDAADAARTQALDKWKSLNIGRRATEAAPDALGRVEPTISAFPEDAEVPAATAEPVAPLAEPTPEQEFTTLTDYYLGLGYTKENAARLATQDIQDKEAESASRTTPEDSGASPVISGEPVASEVDTGVGEPIGTGVERVGEPIGGVESGEVLQPTALEETTEDQTKQKYADFLGKTFKRQLMEAQGQDILDTMDENNISPKDVASKFWNETYFNLPAAVQERFNAELKASTGMEPGSVTAVDAQGNEIRAENWQDIADLVVNDMADKVEYLEGTERGFTVLMDEANRRFAEQPAQEPVIEQQAPQLAAPQVSERERKAAEKLRQQEAERAAERAAAQEEAKALAKPLELAGVAPDEVVEEEVFDEGRFETAKDTLGAFVRQKIGPTESIAPEDIVSTAQALSALADIMEYLIKNGATTVAKATAEARRRLGANAKGITNTQFKQAYEQAKTKLKTEAKAAKEKAKEEKLDKNQIKIARSESPEEMAGTLGEMLEANSWEDVKEIFSASFDTLNSKSIRALLPTLTTMQITDWVGDKITHLKDVNRLVERMSVMRSKMLASVADSVSPWVDFAKKHASGARLLAQTMHYSTLSEVDPSLYGSYQEALAKDSVLQELQNKMANAGTPKSRAAFKGQISARQNALQRAYKMWENLGKVGNGEGHKIYTDIRNRYKAAFNLHRAILDDRIAGMKVPGDINDASTPKGRLMNAIRRTYDGAKQVGVYFPLMRYGNYWMSLGSGANKEFYMFESEQQRNLFIRKRVRQLKKAGDSRTKEQMQEQGDLDFGNDLTRLRNITSESSSMLQEIFTLIDTQGVSDKEALKDSVYQMYLMTMPEQSFRKQFIHRKGTTGFSGDALRNYVRSGYTMANQLSRLQYGPAITNEMDAAYSALEGNPEKPKLEMFLNEIGIRVGQELAPDAENEMFNRIANATNQVAFLWMLTAPASAIANATAIPIFGGPVLASRYGAVKAAAALAKYYNVFNQTTFVKPDGSYTPLSVGYSNYVQSNPVLAAAFEEASERGVTEITRTYDLIAMARTPSASFQNPVSRGIRYGMNVAGLLFHHSERLNREVMFMTSFELAYEKAVADGAQAGIGGEAYNRAIDDAVQNTYDSMFNYTKYNRPRIMRSPPARVVFQFKLFPQQVTAYLIRNGYTMIKGSELDPEARAAATTRLVGTLLMTGMFAGVAGMPLYNVTVGVIQGILEALRDDDEPVPIEERDLDLWFRNKFLPDLFGKEGADIITKGPISTLSNVDIASRTSLNNLWFRDTRYDPSMAATFNQFLVDAAGPGVSLAQNWIKAFDDFRRGHVKEGIEKILPAFARGAYTQQQWGKEGIKTKNQQAIIFAPDEVSTAMRFWKAFGLNPTELTRIQETNFKVSELVKRAQQDKAEILNKLNMGLVNNDVDDMQEAIDEAVSFSIANPEMKFSADSILNSVKNRAKIRAMADRGLIVPKKLAPRLYDFVKASRPKRTAAQEEAIKQRLGEMAVEDEE